MSDERLERVFRLVLGDPDIELTDDTTAADIDGWDSVAHVNLMFAIETEYDIEFEGNEFARFIDIGQLRDSIDHKLGEHAT